MFVHDWKFLSTSSRVEASCIERLQDGGDQTFWVHLSKQWQLSTWSDYRDHATGLVDVHLLRSPRRDGHINHSPAPKMSDAWVFTDRITRACADRATNLAHSPVKPRPRLTDVVVCTAHAHMKERARSGIGVTIGPSRLISRLMAVYSCQGRYCFCLISASSGWKQTCHRIRLE